MKKLYTVYFVTFLLVISATIKGQDTLQWDEIKGKFIIKQIEQLLSQTEKLKKRVLVTDSSFSLSLDTIIAEATRFKIALRRKNKYAVQYKEDFLFYNDQLNNSASLSNTDSVNGIITDVKSDILLKTQSTFNVIDSSTGPSGVETDFKLVNLKVRVFDNNSAEALAGYEVYIKRGTYIPSKDSVRIPQLTDNAVIPISPGNFTIVVWKEGQGGKAPVKIYRKPEFICDIKLQ